MLSFSSHHTLPFMFKLVLKSNDFIVNFTALLSLATFGEADRQPIHLGQ